MVGNKENIGELELASLGRLRHCRARQQSDGTDITIRYPEQVAAQLFR